MKKEMLAIYLGKDRTEKGRISLGKFIVNERGYLSTRTYIKMRDKAFKTFKKGQGEVIEIITADGFKPIPVGRTIDPFLNPYMQLKEENLFNVKL